MSNRFCGIVFFLFFINFISSAKQALAEFISYDFVCSGNLGGAGRSCKVILLLIMYATIIAVMSWRFNVGCFGVLIFTCICLLGIEF